MKADTLKIIFTYTIVAFVIVAGFFVIYHVATSPAQGTDQSGLLAIVGGFVGMCIQFVTGSETATRATNAALRAASTTTTVPDATAGG